MLVQGRIEDLDKGGEVGWIAGQRQTSRGTVEGMLDVAAWGLARGVWHRGTLPAKELVVKKNS
jgi:hypothetical protein